MNGDDAEFEDEDPRVRLAALILKLRAQGISDRRVLGAIESVPRELFVPADYSNQAYEDRALPIDCGQTITAPSAIATVLSSLELSDRYTVLEIGTGSGYQAAILSKLVRRVTSIDRYRTLVRAAESRWDALKLRNISGVVSDGMLGWKKQAPFDRIIVSAATEKAPARLVSQLVDGGMLVAPIGVDDKIQRLTLFQKDGESVETRDLGGVRFVPVVPGIAQNL